MSFLCRVCFTLGDERSFTDPEICDDCTTDNDNEE